LRTADETHALLLAESGRHPVLEIDCSGVTEADLSLVQLLLAARESARRSDRIVRLAQPATGALRDVLRHGGFLTSANEPARSDEAFWLRMEIT
jgi:anti-anti-sigma regulatory factor